MKLNYLPSEIQANIIKGHGRDHACFLFFNLNKKLGGRYLRKEIARFTTAREITSHEKQCEDTSNKQLNKHKFVVGFYLSRQGLKELNLDEGLVPPDPAFSDGMNHQDRMGELGDYFNGDPEPKISDAHVMVMIANSNLEMLQAKVEHLKTEYFNNIAIPKTDFTQWAQTIRDDKERPREHFGYVDGISTPRDESELASMGLFKEHGRDSFGSYVAFRKIEQDIKHFKRMVDCLSGRLGKPEEYAMALLMGRFPDGTPVTLSATKLPEDEWKNTPFDYEGDDGSRCPLHAHIRVVNPRNGESSRPRIIRRSMTYNDDMEKAENGKGLCFLSYQSSIVDNFIPLFTRMKTDPKDTLVYRTRDLIWGKRCDDSKKVELFAPYAKEYGNSSEGYIYQLIGGRELTTFRGGQYFYAPSIPFLTDLEKLGAPE